MPGADAAAPQNTRFEDKSLLHLGLVIIFGIFATTLAQPQVLGKLPLQTILNKELHVSATQLSSFFFLCGLPWYFKPFAGILTDAFPLFGTRRRHYLLIATGLTVLSWIALAFVPRTYNGLLLGCIVVNIFMVIMSTVVGATLVEAGQRIGATGRLSALRQFVSSGCTLINGPIAGALAASGAFAITAGVNAAIAFTILPVAWFFLREKRVHTRDENVLRNASQQLKVIFKSRNLWIGIGFIALYYFAPGFSTPLYLRQSNELKLSEQFIGNLGIYAGIAGLISAYLYSVLIKKLSIRTMLYIGIGTGAVSTLAYLFYNGATQAIIIEAQGAFFGTIAEVALLDLAARSTPKGCEGLGYSLILSVRNLALFGTDILGSKLKDMNFSFSSLVYMNAGTTVIVLFLIPILPAVLMRTKDSDPAPAPAEAAA